MACAPSSSSCDCASRRAGLTLYDGGTLSPLVLRLERRFSEGRTGGFMTTNAERDPTVEERQGNLLMEVSNTMVRLFKDQFGRGPTSARSYWAGPDALMCILEDSLTPAERNLMKLGEHQRLRETRLAFQFASVEAFGRPVEQITGR